MIANTGKIGSKKTHIMYNANLSFNLLRKYLRETINSGLVLKGSKYFIITEKGKEFLDKFEEYEKERLALERERKKIHVGKEELERLLAQE